MSELSKWGDIEPAPAELLTGAPLALLIGATDTGKSTLVARWASILFAKGRSCAVVDADVGQSDIGPPGTVGMGVIEGPIRSLREVEPTALHFVGAFSPRSRALECLTGVSRMVQRARRQRVDHILVDTTGFLEGPLGRALKLNKIQLLDPDLVVCLQRKGECYFLATAFRGQERPRFQFLPSAPEVRVRTPAERTRCRMEALGLHLKDATLRRADLADMALSHWPIFQGDPLPTGRMRALAQQIGRRVLWAEVQGERLVMVTSDPLGWREEERVREIWDRARVEILTPVDLTLCLVGVEDQEGETCAVGVLQRVVFHSQQCEVWVPQRVGEIRGLVFGEISLTQEQWHGIRHNASLLRPPGLREEA